MPLYCGLLKLTEKGRAAIKDSPARNQANLKAAEAMGIKVVGLWGAMGEYDFVAIAEAQTDEAAKLFEIAYESSGTGTLTLFRIFTLEDWAKIVKKLP